MQGYFINIVIVDKLIFDNLKKLIRILFFSSLFSFSFDFLEPFSLPFPTHLIFLFPAP
jgi:hypothetical protein